MSMGLVVEFKLKPGTKQAFIDRVRQHAANCLKIEPGCTYFDVLDPVEGSDTVWLYEVYADKAALDAHVASAHLAAYREDVTPMIEDRSINICRVVGD